MFFQLYSHNMKTGYKAKQINILKNKTIKAIKL